MKDLDEEDYFDAFSSLVGEMANSIIRGPDRIDFTEIGPLAISTVNSIDCGPETAVLDADGEIYILERYETREEAAAGHEKWVAIVSDPTFDGKITALGYKNVIGDEEIEISR